MGLLFSENSRYCCAGLPQFSDLFPWLSPFGLTFSPKPLWVRDSLDDSLIRYHYLGTEFQTRIRTSHIQISAAFFEAIQITWLRGFSLFVGSSKFFTSLHLLTLLYIDCPRNFSTSHRHSVLSNAEAIRSMRRT